MESNKFSFLLPVISSQNSDLFSFLEVLDGDLKEYVFSPAAWQLSQDQLMWMHLWKRSC